MVLLWCSMFPFSLIAQNTSNTINGVVKLDEATAIEFASVALFQDNTSFVKSAITDARGRFSIKNIEPGSYTIRIDHMGYATYISEAFNISASQTVNLPPILLKEENNALDEVVITKKKQMIEVKADKIIFNVASSPSASGTNGLDLLKAAPGVTLDLDNSISLLGKSNVQVYLNGVQSRLSGNDLTTFLQSLTSDTIESIEIISNPGTQYEAEGTGGIINIRLKKAVATGFNGTAASSFTKGEEYRYSNNISLNLGLEKLQTSFDITQSHNNNLVLFDDRKQQNNVALLLDSRDNQIRDGYNVGLALESQLNDKHYVGLNGRAIFNTIDNRLNSFTDIFTVQPPELSEILFSQSLVDGTSTNYLVNGFHLWTLNDDSSITTNLSLGVYDSEQITMQPNTYFEADGSTVIEIDDTQFDSDTQINLWSAKVDYEKNWDNLSLTTGFKYAQVKTQNSFKFFNVSNQIPVFDPTKSNDFDYTENVTAFYTNLNFKLSEKWSLNTGLRIENTDSRGQLFSEVETDNNDVSRNYTDYFPNVSLSYDDQDKHSFSLGIGRRITRPNYQDLNPFESPTSQLVVWKGNPFLNPNYIMNYQVSYAFQQKYILTASYSEITDFFSRIVEITGNESTQIIPRNMEKATTLGLSLSFPVTLTKYWDLQVLGNISRETFKGDVESTVIDIDNTLWNYRIQNNIKINSDLLLDVTLTQRSRWIWRGSVFIQGTQGLSFGIRKDFFDKKLQLRITGSDILRTESEYPYTSDYGGIDLDGIYIADNRRFGLGLTYNFGGPKAESKNIKSGLDEELDRIQN
ncbi:Outer membrane receptor proteins, mostly Fe transport [Formosa sp. Hel1_31_208]|uniref:outer membrane beta-barrel family protein n=1 Tax=Formosa sp. Hel1_31_208 TaxID=1798225 RepID=UPI000879CAD3|nr:outer membrane beta-barrel family protein [Formosa sp. Hel1_31_208]SDS08144.1 Outer membrane receptor proteins, mostly Fe transport [Formosa sp. Hel1_31_208]